MMSLWSIRAAWCLADLPRVFGCCTTMSKKELPGAESLGSTKCLRRAARTSPILITPSPTKALPGDGNEAHQ
jgi:hypothetical protein